MIIFIQLKNYKNALFTVLLVILVSVYSDGNIYIFHVNLSRITYNRRMTNWYIYQTRQRHVRRLHHIGDCIIADNQRGY